MAGNRPAASVVMALLAALLSMPPVQGGPACDSLNCAACNSLGTRCQECSASYFVGWDGFCTKCRDPLCTNCTGPGGSKCLACQSDAPVFSSGPSSVPSFDLSPVPFAPAPAPGGSADFARVYLDAQGVCTICPPGYNKGPCAPECTRGQYRDPATGLCRNCPRLCASCRLEKGRPVCTVCTKFSTNIYIGDQLFPVYRNRQGVCTACQKHFVARGCLACDQDGNCSKCAARYRLVDGACKPCKDRLCAECGPSLDTCQRCLAFAPSPNPEFGDFGPVYRDRQGRCRECTKLVFKGCQSCNALGLCTRCSSGVLRNGGCAPCSSFVTHCAKCDSEGKKCLACKRGYGLQQGRCVPCSQLHGPLCQECSNASRCTYCLATVSKGNFSTTTYLKSKGQCKLCPQSCRACRTDGSCHACAYSYRLSGKGARIPRSAFLALTTSRAAIVRLARRASGAARMAGAAWTAPACSAWTASATAAWTPAAASVLQARGAWCNQQACGARLGLPGVAGRANVARTHRRDTFCSLINPTSHTGHSADYTTCELCFNDAGLNIRTHLQNGRCVQNPPGCDYVDESSGGCVLCQPGWVQVGKQCKKCADPLCLACDAPTQQKCLQCPEYVYDGHSNPVSSVYRGAGGRCQACTMKGCARCKADGRCQECQDGFLLIQGKCVL